MTRWIKKVTLPGQTVLVAVGSDSRAESRALKKARFQWLPTRVFPTRSLLPIVWVSFAQGLAPLPELRAHLARRLDAGVGVQR